MRKHRRFEPLPPQARLVAPLVAVALAALLLARWQPWQARGAPPGPTPAASAAPGPLPSATRAPERIALPPATPALATASPATPGPATPAAPRGDGTVLYLGALDGKEGIIATDADGSGRHLIAAGQYTTVAWNPGGTHFAATGPLDGGLAAQVAIFAADGQPAARYRLDGTIMGPVLWSPEGSRLACALVATNAPRQPIGPAPTETWQINLWGDLQRVAVPDARTVAPFAWTSSGLLAATSYDGYHTWTLWTASADGSYAARDTSGPYQPLALSPDGELLYALGPYPLSANTGLAAIDLRTDAARPIIDADRLGALATGALVTPNTYTIEGATVAPDGAHLALLLSRNIPTQPGRFLIIMATNGDLRLINTAGNITGVVRLPDFGWAGPFAWSPDGTLLAFDITGSTSAPELAIVALDGARRLSQPFSMPSLYGGPVLSWSPDSRWLAYANLNGTDIVSPTGAPSYKLASPGGAPAWRPAGR